ncbi:fungal-specific transcription factor domain-containing protein [Amylocarpus encephaloides]|uniref:Fungal-specific transcription factor domain-containing protein n=1 Tax=Amylocarpus encephaloides TaxID=45428 RepID=A0A9P7YIC1_9HELO|nr:fungal-specific transcription factor domain-containing protein [Amylocarpus encephaloides]
MITYIHHFVTFCSRFLTYPNDSEVNPFQGELVPLATSSPALMMSMAALAAAHLTRGQRQHATMAANYYSRALRELNACLPDPATARLDSTLGACLLLCVYEISYSAGTSSWLGHLQGARDLILYRGGPRTSDYLTRFFSLLDVSGSLSSGGGTLIQGNYWLEDELGIDPETNSKRLGWPYYDDNGVMVDHFHQLMVYMANLSQLSSQSMSDLARENPESITQKALEIHTNIRSWWSQCPPELRDQSNDWRTRERDRKLTVPETLEEEAFSSTKSCMLGCIIYLRHILDPLGSQPQSDEVTQAVNEILEIAKETPEGYGLEMGLYWGLFMAGVAIFNDVLAEDLIRRKLKADTSVSIYHADRALELLEVLWKRQHQYAAKYDWRQVQSQMGIQLMSGKHQPPCRTPSLCHCPKTLEKLTRNTWLCHKSLTMSSTSTKGTILLLGGTGKVSSRIAPLLSKANYATIQASRSSKAVSPCPNCSGVKFDWFDESTYGIPFSGSKILAIFIVAPPVLEGLPLVQKFVGVARKSGVNRFVLLSASIIGVGDGPAMSQVSGYIEGLGVEYAILRPTWFMENFSEQQHLPTICGASQIITATGDGKLPFVSANDIAAVAFHALTNGKPHNTDHLILGPELFTYDEAASLISRHLGRHITHIKISEQDLANGMKSAGMPVDYADMLAQLDTFIKEGKEERMNDCVERITGRKPRKLEEFVQEAVEGGVWGRGT